jgi:transposase-like protein
VTHDGAAAREDCRTSGGLERLARRKVASVMTPTISPEAVKQALVDAGGSVTRAARKLGIASASLRRFVQHHRLLASTVFEQIEQEIRRRPRHCH